ncbi:MAG: hypothetical protein HUJ53_00675 [Holdemanella sp.]|nr:hypothetical protein [Holdemanella sp.]
MYEYKTLNRNIKNENALYECLNAIGILENLNWKSMFDYYIDCLHIYANGPSVDEKNIAMLLKEKGYSKCTDLKKFTGYALIRRGNHFYALIQKEKDLFQYGIVNPIYLKTYDEYEIYRKDFNYTYYDQKKWYENPDKRKQADFNFRNLNPNGKFVGDCTIRALAFGLDINWHEALDLLSKQAYKLNEIHLNHKDVVEKVLLKHDFSSYKHFPVKMTCKEFCKKMDTMFNDEIILVYAGNFHITALKKEYYHYQIQDSWDCSNEIAGDFFVKKKEIKKEENYLERIIIHPTYGEGIIYNQDEKKLSITFNDKDVILLLDWVLKHCEIL